MTPPLSRLAAVLATGVVVAASLAVSAGATAPGDERYPVTGLVVSVAPETRTFVASIERIPGVMEAMTMPFGVRSSEELDGVTPGAVVSFTLVVGDRASHAEDVRVRHDQALDQDPLAARRLALLREALGGRPARALGIGADVPDFTLIDQAGRPFTLSSLRGQVVAVNFIYTTCRLPDFCLRLAHHFAVLQRRFRDRLGRDLSLLTISFDPARDTPAALARYASRWKPDPDQWRFLTGAAADVAAVLEPFGVSAFGNEGLMDHSLRTVLIDRQGRLSAVVEGNKYSSSQLGDLVAAALAAPRER